MSTKAILFLLMITAGSPCLAQPSDSVAQKPPVQLRAVTVTHKRPVIRREADRIIYDLQADPESKGASVLDMMRKVPNLAVEGNEQILLHGSSAYKVFVNGRPSGLLGSRPEEILRSMPASTIKSIEVISPPPAKYDAEGLAGIINIVTIRQTHNGYKGSLNVSGKGPVGGPGGGASHTIRKGDLGVSLLAGANLHRVPGTSGELRRTGLGTGPSTLHQRFSGYSSRQTYYAGLELSFEADSLNLVTGGFSWNSSSLTGSSSQTSTLNGTQLFRHYRLDNSNGNRAQGLEAAFHYQRGSTVHRDRILTFYYQYMQDASTLHHDIPISGRVNYNAPDYTQQNDEGIRRHTAGVDYTLPLKRITVEAGMKGIFRKSISDFLYRFRDTVSGSYRTDPARSNLFSYGQDIFSVYSSVSFSTESWILKGGIRAEETIIGVASRQNASELRQQYLNLLPVLVVTRTLPKKSSLCFSYGRRIQRPSTAELNPFVDRSDPAIESGGNPYLRPIISDAWNLSYLRPGKATVNMSLGGLFFKQVFNSLPFYNPSSGVTTIQPRNYGSGRVLKWNTSVNYAISGRWSTSLNSDIRHVTVRGLMDGQAIGNRGFDVHIFASGGYSFRKGWRVNADAEYRKGGMVPPLGRRNFFAGASFGLRKDLLRSQMTVSATVNNPFAAYWSVEETMTGPHFQQSSVSKTFYRRISCSIDYRFGRLDREVRRPRQGIRDGE